MALSRTDWNNIYTPIATAAGLLISAVAEWLQLRDLTVTLAMRFEEILEYYMAAIKLYIDTKQPGTIYWIPEMAKQFQYGDSLVLINKTPQYAVIDTTKQIIAVVSAKRQSNGGVDIKAAKFVSGTTLGALTNPELIAFNDYLTKKLDPSARFNAISRNPDTVKYTINYGYDPLTAKTDVDSGLAAVLTSFLTGFQDPNGYDGTFFYSQLYENLMSVTGMKDLDLRIDMTLSTGVVVTNMRSGTRELPAGYFNWDPTSIKTGTALP